MLRYKEKVDVEARIAEVDDIVERWQIMKEDVPEALISEFDSKLMVSMIFHDSALEGEVLSYGEIKAAIDTEIISDTSLIPAYEDTVNFFTASTEMLKQATNKKKPLRLETVHQIQRYLVESDEGLEYRTENPLHRLYYHEIAAPETIQERMDAFGKWLESSECKDLHPIQRAVDAHAELMSIFPWLKSSGRVARIMSNYLLENAKYPLGIIHSIDRQKYYEALRNGPEELFFVYLEAVETTATSALRVFEEALRRGVHAS